QRRPAVDRAHGRRAGLGQHHRRSSTRGLRSRRAALRQRRVGVLRSRRHRHQRLRERRRVRGMAREGGGHVLRVRPVPAVRAATSREVRGRRRHAGGGAGRRGRARRPDHDRAADTSRHRHRGARADRVRRARDAGREAGRRARAPRRAEASRLGRRSGATADGTACARRVAGVERVAPLKRFVGTALAAVMLLSVTAACTSSGKKSNNGLGDPGNCIVVDVATSPEKGDLMLSLAKSFNGSDQAKLGKDCIFVRPQNKSSGAAAQLLYTNWNEATDGPRPVVWSPAASSWGQLVNEKRTEAGQGAIVPNGEPFMLTPLTIAMPKPMADALGYPATPIGWSDILPLAKNQQGWAAFGHPEWGPFKLGKTNPNFSTSGLNALIAQTYAASGKTSGLSAEDLANPDVVSFGTGVESSVVHYGDTTLTFLNNLYRADQRGQALTYVSAVAVEEKSVIDYNLGNPD